MKRGIALALCVLAALGISAGCSSDSDGTKASLTANGRTEVADAGGAWRPVSNARSIGSGDAVRVVDGTAGVVLSQGRRLELRTGSHVKMGVVAGTEDLEPSLVAGDLLVELPTGNLTVSTTDTSARFGQGAARITRGSSVVVASYSAPVVLESAGRSMEVRPLRQAAVPAAGLLPPGPSPLSYSASDPWDQRYLAETVQLGGQLVARSRGFTAQLRQGEADDPAFMRQLVPAFAPQPVDPSLEDPARPPGERLIGLVITTVGTRGSFLERWQSVTAFHDEGADWGLVALDQGVARVPLLAEVDAALGRGPSLLPETPPTPAPATAAPTPPPPTALVSDEGSPEPSPSEQAAVSPRAETGPEPTGGVGGPLNTGVELVDTTVNSLVDALSGLLQSLGR